ncbi:hypothetical protein ACJ73_09434, partial [Blastomyces percursus]
MSSLPTPQSDRRRTLRSHSRAQVTVPIKEETSDEGDITQYAEATEEATEEAPEIVESSTSHNAEARHESDDGTPSPRATRTARPTGSFMPRMSPDGMISMTLEDLMAFCDRMNTRRNDDNTPADDYKSTIREYQKDIQKAMDTKAVTTFDGTNYQAWRIGILADTEVIGGTDILTKNQGVCPQEYDALDTEKWNIRTKALYRRMLQSLLGPVRTTIGALEPDNAAALWETIGLEYAVSLAEERLNITRELATLHVKDNDYLAFQRRYRYLIARHKELGVTAEDIHYDMFLISLREYQKVFVKMRLDEFFATGKDPIRIIDIDDLMKQLTNRTSKKDNDRPKAPRADAATSDNNGSNSNNNASSNSSTKCNFCDLSGRNRATCWRLHPELATERWRKTNKDKIVNTNESSGDRSSPEHRTAFSRSIEDFHELLSLIDDATAAMGLDGSKAFARDVLSVGICGPERPQLTLVDLPGLIHSANKSQSDDDVELIKSLVEDYIAEERTIILAIVSAKNDYANQVILKNCREFDPKGTRTFGIITKPDYLRPGSDNERAWLDLAQNRDIFFELGWHLLKNRADDEHQLLFAECNLSEHRFLNSGSCKSLPQHIKGIDSLRERLSQLLFQHLKRELPILKDELDGMARTTRMELLSIGASCATLTEQRVYLAEFFSSAYDIVAMSMTGNYEGSFFGNIDINAPINKKGNSRRLRAVVQHLNIKFAERMHRHGHRYYIQEEDPDETPEPQEKSMQLSRNFKASKATSNDIPSRTTTILQTLCRRPSNNGFSGKLKKMTPEATVTVDQKTGSADQDTRKRATSTLTSYMSCLIKISSETWTISLQSRRSMHTMLIT